MADAVAHEPGAALEKAKGGGEIHTSEKSRCCCKPFDPRTKRSAQWDVLILVLLLYTTYVTPYEVAFLQSKLNVLFVINRFVDLVFILDLIRNFNVAYFDENEQYWVGVHHKIAKRCE